MPERTNNVDSPSELWRREYESEGIPSSFLPTPSGALLEAFVKLKDPSGTGLHAVDVGCGSGRNALFLAQRGFAVDAFDLVSAQIELLHESAKRMGLTVTASVGDATQTWPVDSGSADFVSDTFCFKHLIHTEEQEKYIEQLYRVIKKGGHYLLSLAGHDDGYYGSLERILGFSQQVIVDPANHIGSVLYSKEEILQFHASSMELVAYWHKAKDGTMHGHDYPRSTHVFLFQRL